MGSMEEKLKEYAQLLVRVGLNVRKGQTLVISSPVECAFFARLCAAEAYEAGCREVVMNWSDDVLGRMKYLHAEDDVFDTVPPVAAALLQRLRPGGGGVSGHLRQ